MKDLKVGDYVTINLCGYEIKREIKQQMKGE